MTHVFDCPLPARQWLLGVLLVSSSFAAAAAADPADPAEPTRLRWSGFATAGAVWTDADEPWGFRRDNLQRSSHARPVQMAADSRLGLQGNLRLGADWELVTQAVAKRRVDSTPWTESVEWAFLSYRPRHDTVLRAGRTSPDMFLLADYRNVGFAYPWVRPSVNVYGWMPLYSMDGIDLTRDFDTGASSWRFKAYAGTSRTTVPGGAGEDITLRARDMIGGTLTHERGGLTLKLSLNQIRLEMSGHQQIEALGHALDGIAKLPVPRVAAEAHQLRSAVFSGTFETRYAAAGASYDIGPWSLQGELSRVSSELPNMRGLNGYGSIAYRHASVTWYAMVGRSRPSREPLSPPTDWAASLTPLIGAGNAATAQWAGTMAAYVNNLGRLDQTSYSLGLRWDLHARKALKLQVDQFRVREHGGVLWADATPEARRVNALSIALDSVF
ncbi:hypothetical protein [Caldimonas brevitalea]|uniref:Porin domain-containing protein n=1 Tax=Caldimonas brevitalea TaxID=413882 RepID=A0A0G3BK29_9BURK|nr:hypothetical protein [Caldimonas brevitalea]AKJ29789.1 hypothetical protein AAW51_3098 [Caldimonas brevitalea]